MIKAILFQVCSAFLLFVGMAHDAPIAMFKLQDQVDHTTVHITLDAEDVSRSIQQPIAEIELEDLKHYLNDHLQIQINAHTEELNLTSSYLKMDHLHVQGRMNTSLLLVEDIKIWNTCLLEVDNQSNIIQFRYDDNFRDFRMTKDRMEIEVEL